MLGAGIAPLWLALVTLLLALVPGAAFVSVLNDVTDREDDERAGKPNRIAGRSPLLIAALLGIPLLIGMTFLYLWRHDTLLVSCYLSAWVVFSLYSIPPFRFKTRGFLGVLCDASGANLFPTLVAVIVTFRALNVPLDWSWVSSVGIWAFAYGLRGILWHQLTDRDNDTNAAVRTFAQRNSRRFVERLGTFVVFPIELIALFFMLAELESVAPVVALAAYGIIARKRIRKWHLQAVIVSPKERFFIVLNEYYYSFFPLSLLIASAVAFPIDIVVLLVHIVLFLRGHLELIDDIRRLWFERFART